MSEQHNQIGADPDFDVDDPSLTRFDLVREGARRDGVEIVHYEPKFPVPGTAVEKRIVRTIALFFLLTGVMAIAFIVAYIAWPWRYDPSSAFYAWYTPVLGITLALTLFGIGFGIITWAKKLLPDETAVQERHLGGSPHDEQMLTGATLTNLVEETGIKRRPLLKGAVALGLAPVGVAALAPLIGGLIKDPHHPNVLFYTAWAKNVRLIREDGSPIRPEDVSAGGMLTVFPDVPGGTTNENADSPTLLIHLNEQDAQTAAANANALNKGSQYGNFVAYSKICTHAGCPPSLFEHRTNRLLCPCHQSQFLITDNARPVFGPATRSLPQLPIALDSEGFFIATSDYKVPIGPSFWERP